ncbi:MAG: TnpV protein [Lachnospiraceae bacterium]|nr:TnpV protein [Lachnospiraceae bacterium]
MNTYLADIDTQAQGCFERLVGHMKQSQGISEQLKTEKALEWVGRMNNIRNCAMEILERYYLRIIILHRKRARKHFARFLRYYETIIDAILVLSI